MSKKPLRRAVCAALIAALSLSALCLPASAAGSMRNFVKNTAYNDSFSDVSRGDWFLPYVSDCYGYGLVAGKGGGVFKPYDYMTCAEVITFACRIHSIYNGGSGVIASQPGQVWYWGYVEYAVANELIDEYTFDDYTVPCTRAEAAYTLCRALPEYELAAINDVSNVPTVTEGEWEHFYAAEILRLYRAGVLTGKDSYGTFGPDDSVKRCEAITMVNRIVNPAMRKVFTLEHEIDVSGSYLWKSSDFPNNYITFNQWAQTFSLNVNVLEGYLKLTGSYTRSGEYIDCTVEKGFYGFAGGDTETMQFRVTAPDTLVLTDITRSGGRSADYICMIPLNGRFDKTA